MRMPRWSVSALLAATLVAAVNLVTPGTSQASPGEDLGDAPGYFHLESRKTSKCLDPITEGIEAGQVVEQQPCKRAKSQEWVSVPVDGGTGFEFRFHNHNSGLCLQEGDPGAGNGSPVVQGFCNVPWAVWHVALPGQYANSYDGRCLDVENGWSDNGLPMQVWDCAGTINQVWELA